MHDHDASERPTLPHQSSRRHLSRYSDLLLLRLNHLSLLRRDLRPLVLPQVEVVEQEAAAAAAAAATAAAAAAAAAAEAEAQERAAALSAEAAKSLLPSPGLAVVPVARVAPLPLVRSPSFGPGAGKVPRLHVTDHDAVTGFRGQGPGDGGGAG